MRVARAFDEAQRGDETAARFARIATPIAKYWLNKRAPQHVAECLECLGGAGYVEESPMPRLYREAPLNGIWEGSGNVVCLDVLRAVRRDPESLVAFLEETKGIVDAEPALAQRLAASTSELQNGEGSEIAARRITETLARLLQVALLTRHAPSAVADAFRAARLDGDGCYTYGTLPPGIDLDQLIARAAGGLA